jgi:hypothetical protein
LELKMAIAWVRILGDGSDPFAAQQTEKTGPYRPESGVPYPSIPCDLDEASPNYGKPLLSVCRVRIAAVQGDRSPDEKAPVPVLPLAEVSPSARDIAITMACSIPRIGPFVDGAQAREVFKDIVAEGDRHQLQVSVPILQEALLQAVRRGLRVSDAEAIARELGISV